MIGLWKTPDQNEQEKLKGFDDYQLSLGDVMRGERATLGKSLLDIQKDLHIKTVHLAAIENCDVSAFETPGFIAGYVRSYARYLSMDPDHTFRWFCHESGFQTADGMSVSQENAAQRAAARKENAVVPFSQTGIAFNAPRQSVMSRIEPGAIGSIVVMLCLIAGIGYGAWTVVQKIQQVEVAKTVEAPVQIVGIDPLSRAIVDMNTVPDQTELASNSAAFDRLYAPAALDMPVLDARDGPISAVDPQAAGILAAAASLQPQEPEPEPVVQVTEEVDPGVYIVAVRPAWVSVRDANGAVLYEKIMNPGEEYEVPQIETPPTLLVGESGAVYFTVNGQHYGPPGESGAVTRDIVLTSDALTSTFPQADPDQDADFAHMLAQADAE